mmetsp:Transcript_17391/g.32991  ORF Transcript_17391/g.32991 Transcript_17391/m.32991 type:complete len:97 (+) Transcript_17391:937-1227(+)
MARIKENDCAKKCIESERENIQSINKHLITFTLIWLTLSLSIERWYSPMVHPNFLSVLTPSTLPYTTPQHQSQVVAHKYHHTSVSIHLSVTAQNNN